MGDSSMTSIQTVIPLLLLSYLTSTLVSGMSPGVRCSCGVEGNARIVSGQNVPRGKYPWVAIVTKKNSTKIGGCGAALISYHCEGGWSPHPGGGGQLGPG